MVNGLWLMYAVGAGIRLWLMNNTAGSVYAARRVELSTPLNSWKRVQEGVFLHEKGVAVYSGGVFHETPLCLFFGGFLIRSWQAYLPFIFVACDLLTAFFLASVASSYSRQLLQQQKSSVKLYASDATHLLLKSTSLSSGVLYVAAAYLFSPYTIASCLAKTTTVFANLVLAAALVSMVQGFTVLFGILVALATYQSFYPVCLLVPGILRFTHTNPPSKLSMIKPLLAFFVTMTVLMLVSSEISGGWEFIEATYGFILSAPDLTPNIGLFWYFFTEMFEHFKCFFIATFQINAFVYVLPLAIRLRNDPVLLAMALLAFTAVFRSYPSLGDVGLYLALLPMWKHLYPFMRQTFIVGCMLVATSVLGPIMFHLWIYNGSANANFYFAVTLAFNTAQIFLITDLLFAHVKREYHLYHGSKMEVDGVPARLMLQ